MLSMRLDADEPTSSPTTEHSFISNCAGQSAHSVGFSSDGKTMVTADDPALVWDLVTGRPVRSFKASLSAHVAISPDGKRVLLDDIPAQLFDAATGKLIRGFKDDNGQILSVAFSRDGKKILTGSNNLRNNREGAECTAALWDAGAGNEIQAFRGHTGTIGSVAISPDGKQVLTGSEDSTARLWNAATGVETYRFIGQPEQGMLRGHIRRSAEQSPRCDRALGCKQRLEPLVAADRTPSQSELGLGTGPAWPTSSYLFSTTSKCLSRNVCGMSKLQSAATTRPSWSIM
jgi:WD40 repeat protein